MQSLDTFFADTSKVIENNRRENSQTIRKEKALIYVACVSTAAWPTATDQSKHYFSYFSAVLSFLALNYFSFRGFLRKRAEAELLTFPLLKYAK